MDTFSTYEYVVSPAKQGKVRVKKILTIVAYVLLTIGLFALVFTKFKAAIPALACVPVLIWLLVWLTWRFVSVEYEYSMTSGVMTLSNIYGNRNRKKVDEVKITSMTWIAPLSQSDEKIREYSPEVTIDMTSSLSSPDVYAALYENEKGRRVVLYFEATAQALKIMRFYNHVTIVGAVRF